MSEIWKPVVGYEGLYEVSSEGRVQSLPRMGKERATRKYGGRLLTTTTNKTGYLYVWLSDMTTGRKGVSRRVHRLVAEAFIGPRPEGQVIRHLDGNQKNNAVWNLAYGTGADNYRDSVRHGTKGRPELHPMAKISWEIADNMRALRSSGRSTRQIAEQYGVEITTVRDVVAGRRWFGVLCGPDSGHGEEKPMNRRDGDVGRS